MAIYGELLAYFPELIKTHTIFSMQPKIGGGYETRIPIVDVRGTFIREGQSKMKVFGDARVENEAGILYVFDRIPKGEIKQGTYFEDDGEVMVIMNDATFSTEAGFSAYGCQLVTGLTDLNVENVQVSENIRSDFGD